MIISFTRHFIFVHVYRTGGTSVFRVLAPEWDLRVALRAMPQSEWPAQLRALDLNPAILNLEVHATARELRRTLGDEIFKRYFKFAFVRNPWDHVLSHYLFIMTHPQMPEYPAFAAHSNFGAYVRSTFKPGVKSAAQRGMLCDDQGVLLVDFVGKFETLNRDFQTVCERIGVPPIALALENETPHGPWRFYYDRETFELVRAARQDDIETFGYASDPEAYGIPLSGVHPATTTGPIDEG